MSTRIDDGVLPLAKGEIGRSLQHGGAELLDARMMAIYIKYANHQCVVTRRRGNRFVQLPHDDRDVLSQCELSAMITDAQPLDESEGARAR